MMKEEKNTINTEIIELISCKETIDSIVKSSLHNLNNNGANNNIGKESDEENNINLPELYLYELNLVNSSKASKEICENIYDVFNLKNIDIDLNLNNNNITCNNNNNEWNEKELRTQRDFLQRKSCDLQRALGKLLKLEEERKKAGEQ